MSAAAAVGDTGDVALNKGNSPEEMTLDVRQRGRWRQVVCAEWRLVV